MRVDELTIHPRDNALLVATHGRALWILDHLEPIQEYAAAQKADVALFTPGLSLQWKSKDDRNDEFWGHQFFTGENPPVETVLQFNVRKPATKPSLRITDASGAVVRELAVPDARNQPGIQTVCWDQRVEPVACSRPAPAPVVVAVAVVVAVVVVGGGFGGAGGPRPIAGMPTPLPPVGYLRGQSVRRGRRRRRWRIRWSRVAVAPRRVRRCCPAPTPSRCVADGKVVDTQAAQDRRWIRRCS